MSAKKLNQKKPTAAALMRAIQLQDSMDKRAEAPEMKNASSQTEPNESAEENDSLNTKMNKCLLLLSHVNTKVDALGAKQFQQPGPSSNDRINVNLAKITLQPVKSLADFESLEESCRDENFKKATVASIGNIHGRNRFTGQGATVSLRIIDYFFARDFLLKCSWTGATRTSGNEETKRQKIPFMKFDKTIDLFYQTVLYSDPTYTLVECKSFLHRCLKNSQQRFAEVSGTRKPVARKRKRLPTEDQLRGEVKDCIDNGSSDEGPLEKTTGSSSWQVEFLESYEDDENLPPQTLKAEQ